MSVSKPLRVQKAATSLNVPRSFDILPFTSVKCRVHPVVILTILDAYVRRDEGQLNVIGTLLGIVAEGNVIEITDCFVDRHSLTDGGLLQIIKDHHESMYELKQHVNPKEQVVGWFSTGCEITELTCAVHGWFKSFNSVSKFYPQNSLSEPIHLMVDTSMENGLLSIKAFVQVVVQLVRDACHQFQEIPMETYTSSADRAGISMLIKARDAQRRAKRDEIPQLKDGFQAALDRLLELLQKCQIYVRRVLDGSEKPNSDIGRFLTKALCCEALQDVEQFERLCQNSLQDNLMVAYLSNLARLQFAVAEKLNTSFF